MEEAVEQQIEVLQTLWATLIEFAVKYSFNVMGAVITLLVGVIIANAIHKVLLKMFAKKQIDVTLAGFMAGFARVIVLGFAIVIAMGKFGITIAPFIAAIGAMAFGASFAFQGPLANYGAGLSIVITRPFVVGDTITVQGQSGVVSEVKLACTRLHTEDGVVITIPNKHIVGEVIHNSKQNRVVESQVGISYSDDPEKAIQIIRETLKSFSQITQDPRAQVGINDFGDSSVNIGVRYWVPTKQYFQSLYLVNLAIFKALQLNNITIPFPQRDVNIKEKIPA